MGQPAEDVTIRTDETIASGLTGRPSTVGGADIAGETIADDGDRTTADTPGGEVTVAAPAVRRSEPAHPQRPPAGHVRPSEVRYVVVGVAGQGGMGTVHVAKDVDLLRRVALKEMTPDAALNADARARFIREVQVTAQLDHPYVVPVYGLEVSQGERPAYAMKLVDGRTFGDLIADTRALIEADAHLDEAHTMPARLEQFLKVCDAVSYAHERGVIHRDLKPANVMLGSHNEVYVMDWGLCRVLAQPDVAGMTTAARPDTGAASEASATLCGSVVGTPRYMAPEQARGETSRMGPHSDQYSLGLILQELVTLRQAVTGGELGVVLGRAAEGWREPLAHASGESLPAELAAIITKATAVDPAHRYETVSAFAADLRRYLRGDAVEARPDTPWQRLLRYVARHRQAAGVLVLSCAALCLAVIVGLLWRHDRALAAQQVRERRLQVLTSQVAEQGDVLQTRLLQAQAAIAGLSNALEEAAEHGVPMPGVVSWYDPAAGPQVEGAAVLTWLGSGPPTADTEAVVNRVRTAARRVTPWLALTEAQLTGRAPNTPSAAGSTRAITRVQAVFDAGFQVAALGPDGVPPDPRHEPWFADCRAASGVSVRAVDAAAGGHGVTFCSAMRDDEGQPLGTLLVTLSLRAVLASSIEDWPLRRDGVVALLDSHHRLRTGGTSGAGRDGLKVPWGLLSGGLSTSDAGFVETQTPDGPIVVAFDRLHPFEWTLVVALRSSALFAGETGVAAEPGGR